MSDIAGVARKIVAAIEYDLSDRRGLGQEWDRIDDDVRREIRRTWAKIIREKLSNFENQQHE
jgi:hypothetical protein